MSNKDTRNALSTSQKAILAKPFFSWDKGSLKVDVGNKYMLQTRMNEEKRFVAEVESVLHDLATHLPDIGPR